MSGTAKLNQVQSPLQGEAMGFSSCFTIGLGTMMKICVV